MAAAGLGAGGGATGAGVGETNAGNSRDSPTFNGECEGSGSESRTETATARGSSVTGAACETRTGSLSDCGGGVCALEACDDPQHPLQNRKTPDAETS